jgi:hypothetical protein
MEYAAFLEVSARKQSQLSAGVQGLSLEIRYVCSLEDFPEEVMFFTAVAQGACICTTQQISTDAHHNHG